MPKAKRRLSNLDIREVAFCREGMHPRADIVLYKAREEQLEKGAISYASAHRGGTPKAAESMAWEGGREVARAGNDPGQLRRMHAWIDPDGDPANKGSYKLPHHRADGTVVLRGVQAAMGAIMGARTPLQIPAGDRRGVYNHLAQHLRAFDREPPEFVQRSREAVEKVEGEPRDFRDHLETARAMEIDSALDRRLHALLATTTEIMRAEVENREERILRAVADYAETMERDVPELFAGRLAKALMDEAADGRPSDGDLQAVVESALAEAGLLPGAPASGGNDMDFLKALTERGRAALDYILGDRKADEFFKGTPEGPAKLVVGLLEKAAEWAERIDGLEADLAKARKPSDGPPTLEGILKGIADPGVRTYVETQAAGLSKVSTELAALRKETRHKELVSKAQGYECLPNADGELVEALEKAEGAGCLEVLERVFEAANRQARIGKVMAELGVETIPGEGGGAMTPDEADQALVAKGTEFRKADPSLTAEAAYTMACERNQDLYVMTQKRHATQAQH